jgi:hypothetical protein
MKWLAMALFLGLFLVVPAAAKSPTGQGGSPGIGISPGEVAATPDMWFYEQSLRQYNDPKSVIRQKAEFRTAERLRRMAALRWFGFSNSRPSVGVDPIHGDYGAFWSSGNVYQPFRWSGARAPAVVVVPSSSSGRSN